MKIKHPIEKANWLWHKEQIGKNNVFLHFRKTFDVYSSKIQKSEIQVAAFSIYELYINGRYVGRGPAAGPIHSPYFDTYDLKRILKKGKNVIAALVYNYGRKMPVEFLTNKCAPGGFRFALVLKTASRKDKTITSDETAKVIQNPCWMQDTPLYMPSHRAGFKEFYDSRKEDAIRGWRKPDFDDSGWAKADTVKMGRRQTFRPRDIGHLTREPHYPVNVFINQKMYDHNFDLPKEFENLQALVKGADGALYDKALLAGESGAIESHKTRLKDRLAVIRQLDPQSPISIMLDFGKNITGRFALEIEESAGGILEISYGESLNTCRVDRLILKGGRQTFSPFDRRHARYVILEFKKLPAPVKLKSARFDLVTYPVRPLGEFKCSDELLNEIRDVGAYTIRLCMQDKFEDCPWREQALYLADMRWIAGFNYFAFGDCELVKRCLRLLARIQREDGLIPTALHWEPLESFIIDFQPHFVGALAEYYQFSGDRYFIRELFPAVRKLMRWMKNQLQPNNLVTIKNREHCWCFIDWGFIEKRDEVTSLNLLWYEAFLNAARLAGIVGDEKLARAYTLKAERIKRAVQKNLKNKKKRIFMDCRKNGKLSSHTSEQTNSCAVLLDIAEKEDFPYIRRNVFKNKKVKRIVCGFMKFYAVEALFKMGYGTEALDEIRNYWGRMIERGATTLWEAFDPETPEGLLPGKTWSLCHAFSAGPNFSLPFHIFGIEILEPGMKKIRLKPNLFDLEWARGKIPTPFGSIEVKLERKGGRIKCDVKAPAGVSVIVEGQDGG